LEHTGMTVTLLVMAWRHSQVSLSLFVSSPFRITKEFLCITQAV